MNSELESVLAEDPPAVVLGELEVTTLGDEDIPRAAILLDEEHYLGAARPVGRTLFQAVHHRGLWVALFMWGAAALKLTDRDAEIGWTDRQRAERIGLIVQNRRFLVLAKTRMPNLASRALALARISHTTRRGSIGCKWIFSAGYSQIEWFRSWAL